MSALTKLFVTLLIICSLLLTAAVVVFVNQQTDWRDAYTASTKVRDQARADLATAQMEADAARTREAKTSTDLNAAIAKLQGDLAAQNTILAQAKSDISKLENKALVNEATITQMATGLKSAQQNVADEQKRNETLIAENDKLRVQQAELVGANTDYQKRLDEAERERRWLNEQVVQLRTELGTTKGLLVENNIPLKGDFAKVRSAPDIKGVILETKQYNGQTYATISVGSADKVEKGMQFNVVDQDQNLFLGKLTVDSVDPNQAFGRLEGPLIDQVRQNVQVRTQL